MGLFSGSTTNTTNEKFDTGPSSFQRPYLDQSFNAAQDTFNRQKGSPYYQGATYAGMSADAKKALTGLRDFASGNGMATATTLNNIGTNLAGNAGRAGQYIDRYAEMAGQDPQQANLAAAGRYADNPFINGQIDANTRDVTRNLREDILPNIDRAASAGGNLNSSRAGIASGIAQRGAADRIADISANIRGNAWSDGLDRAQSDRATQMAGMRGAADAYTSLGQVGMDALSRGTEAGYGAFDRINSAGMLEQGDRQGYLDQDFQKWKGGDEREWDILDRYNSIVGGNQWGQSGTSSGTSKQKSTGGLLGQIVGAASTAAGIFSDPRLKKNITKIGELFDGLGVYVWSYIWQPNSTTNVGVMANEVQELRPWALGPEVDGYQTVNYGKL